MKDNLVCLKGHILKSVNSGFGTYGKKTRCSSCKSFGKDEFLSCPNTSCKYNLCKVCQEKMLSSRVANEKEETECRHLKENLTFNSEKLESGKCKYPECKQEESDGYSDCNSKINSEEGSNGISPRNNGISPRKMSNEINGEVEVNAQDYLNAKADSQVNLNANTDINSDSNVFTNSNVISNSNSGENICEGGCSCQRSSNGFMNRTVCNKKLCMICFETNYPDQVGMYPLKDLTINANANVTANAGFRANVEAGGRLEVGVESYVDTCETYRAEIHNNNKLCQKGHALTELHLSDSNKKCNKCSLTGLTQFWYCSQCDYTHCQPCYNGEINQSMTCEACCIIY